MDQLPRLGKRELICLLSFTCNYVVFVWRGFLFLWVLGMGYVILLWHSLSLPYNYLVTKATYMCVIELISCNVNDCISDIHICFIFIFVDKLDYVFSYMCIVDH